MFQRTCPNCQTPTPYSNNSNELCSECEIRSNRRHATRSGRPSISSGADTIKRSPSKSEGTSIGFVVLMIVAVAFLAFCASQGDAKATRGLVKIGALLFIGVIVGFFRMLFGRKNADC